MRIPSLFLSLLCLLVLSRPAEARADEPAQHWLLLAATEAGQSIIAVGERGSIILSKDNGTTWLRAKTGATNTLTGVCFTSAGSKGWAAGHDGLILATQDGGLSWTQAYKSADPEAAFLHIACLGDSHVLAVGAFGLAVESKDAGATWQPVRIGNGDRHLNHISIGPKGLVLITGESGLVLRSLDEGLTWEELPTPYEGSFFGSQIFADGRILVHGLRGHLFLLNEDKSWTELPAPAPALLACSVLLRDGSLLLGGQARCFIHGKGNVPAFTAWPTDLTTGVACLLQTKNGTLLAFGEAGVSRLPAP